MPKRRRTEAAKKDGRNKVAKRVERMAKSVNCEMIALYLKPWRP